ncbi:MAG: MAPEG family protein [Leptolyngbyaceae cyanobacterium]|uniref:MAPEG family protein n=1 Tax=Leptodesmis sichuanensis TaxID=2906798 RepID=UPI001F194563|nr:MAPEG family protein [Leptodesmis sichuanensis]UIE38641.1 MAPEG family protein [Leptodesmis sichuanensis A121]
MTPYPAFITLLALILYFVLGINVGRARVKYKVMPPQMSGDPNFERVLRVQQNTLEQLVLFLPAFWLFCQYVSPVWGSVLGAVWIVGRILYAWGYYQASEKRIPGFGIAALATIALLLGALIGVMRVLFQQV